VVDPRDVLPGRASHERDALGQPEFQENGRFLLAVISAVPALRIVVKPRIGTVEQACRDDQAFALVQGPSACKCGCADAQRGSGEN
jgi:hypothetical protein